MGLFVFKLLAIKSKKKSECTLIKSKKINLLSTPCKKENKTNNVFVRFNCYRYDLILEPMNTHNDTCKNSVSTSKKSP